MMSDRNEDNIVTESEANQFMLRIRAFAGRRGKILDEQVILNAFKRSMSHRPGNNNNNNSNWGAPTGQSTMSMFEIVQGAMSDEMPEPTTSTSTAGSYGGPTVSPDATSQQYPPQPFQNSQSATRDNGFITLKKMPRVTPTGLVVTESKDEEGNLAHPIRVEDLLYDMPRTTSNIPGESKGPISTSNADKGNQKAATLEEENGDIVSMILRSFSGGPVFSFS